MSFLPSSCLLVCRCAVPVAAPCRPGAARAAPQPAPVRLQFLAISVVHRRGRLRPGPAEGDAAAGRRSDAQANLRQPEQLPFQATRLPKVVLYGLQLTFYEHVMRVATQDFTRKQLKGPFLQDWFDSVSTSRKVERQGPWQVNYLGHAIHGGAFARIWLEQREPKPTSKTQYFKQIGRAFLFTVDFQCAVRNRADVRSLDRQCRHVPARRRLGRSGMDAGRIGAVDDGRRWHRQVLHAWIEQHVPFMMAKAAARMIGNPSACWPTSRRTGRRGAASTGRLALGWQREQLAARPG